MVEAHPTADDFRVEDCFGYLLRRAHRASFQLAEQAFRTEELSFTQWLALVHLRDGLVDTAGGLARSIGHDSGAMTRMLDQLEARDLIVRDRSRTDRRVVHLSLTAAGIAAANDLVPRISALWENLLGDFPAEDVELMSAMLRRLITRLDSANDEGMEA